MRRGLAGRGSRASAVEGGRGRPGRRPPSPLAQRRVQEFFPPNSSNLTARTTNFTKREGRGRARTAPHDVSRTRGRAEREGRRARLGVAHPPPRRGPDAGQQQLARAPRPWPWRSPRPGRASTPCPRPGGAPPRTWWSTDRRSPSRPSPPAQGGEGGDAFLRGAWLEGGGPPALAGDEDPLRPDQAADDRAGRRRSRGGARRCGRSSRTRAGGSPRRARGAARSCGCGAPSPFPLPPPLPRPRAPPRTPPPPRRGRTKVSAGDPPSPRPRPPPLQRAAPVLAPGSASLRPAPPGSG